jgi:hypothetical protein
MNSRGCHISLLFSLNVELDFSSFQRLIGVQDEDSCGKSSLCETCPATGLRGTCHKSIRPRRQRTPSWPNRLMPPTSEQSPSAFLPAGLPRRLTGYPRKAKSCTEIISGIKGLYFNCSYLCGGF